MDALADASSATPRGAGSNPPPPAWPGASHLFVDDLGWVMVARHGRLQAGGVESWC